MVIDALVPFTSRSPATMALKMQETCGLISTTFAISVLINEWKYKRIFVSHRWSKMIKSSPPTATNAQLLSIELLGTNFTEIQIKIQNFCPGGNKLPKYSTYSSMIHIEFKMQTWPMVWDNGYPHNILMYLLCKHWGYTGGPFYQYGFTLILTWISDHLLGKFVMQLLIHSQTSTVTLLKFGNG